MLCLDVVVISYRCRCACSAWSMCPSHAQADPPDRQAATRAWTRLSSALLARSHIEQQPTESIFSNLRSVFFVSAPPPILHIPVVQAGQRPGGRIRGIRQSVRIQLSVGWTERTSEILYAWHIAAEGRASRWSWVPGIGRRPTCGAQPAQLHTSAQSGPHFLLPPQAHRADSQRV